MFHYDRLEEEEEEVTGRKQGRKCEETVNDRQRRHWRGEEKRGERGEEGARDGRDVWVCEHLRLSERESKN